MKRYTNEFIFNELTSIVRDSKTYADVCRKLNVVPGGGNQSYIKKVIQSAKLDTSHFVGMTWAKGTTHSRNRKYDNLRDEYTGFRIFLSRAKSRSTDPLSLTLDDLVYQWKKQNGKCVYSGVSLILRTNTRKSNRLFTASLDRIDSNEGYVKNNIQFVSVICNLAKNKITHDEMIQFCNIIRNFDGNKLS